MLGPELVDMVAVFAWGHTLRQQQKEETIRAEISDGIRRLSSRCRVRFSGIYGSRARVEVGAGEEEFARLHRTRLEEALAAEGFSWAEWDTYKDPGGVPSA